MFKPMLPLLLASASALAGDVATPPAVYGADQCRIAAVLPAPGDGKVNWDGACKDGYAEGPGVLAWTASDAGARRIKGVLVHGNISGEATLTWGKAGTQDSYVGTLHDGQPDGQGFFQYADGAMYEGGVVAGKPGGTGIRIDADRSRYEGDWHDGKRHGNGTATYTLGGSYTGAWKNDRFDGAGTIVYAGAPHTWQGRFHDGRPEGVLAPVLDTPRDYYSGTPGVLDPAERMTGSRSYLPPKAAWGDLSVEQQNLAKARYPTLAPGDEPPYPLRRQQTMGVLIDQIARTFDQFHGVVWMYVTVGADGKALSARAIGKVPEAMGRYLSAAVMSQSYKPALCQGTPCQMIAPMGFQF